MCSSRSDSVIRKVAPYAGAWIEIHSWILWLWYDKVAPYAGAWIEIKHEGYAVIKEECRSLRGSVD